MRFRDFNRIWLLGFWLIVRAYSAGAHEAGSSYLHIQLSQDALAGRWEIDLHDLARAVSLDINGNGALTQAELRERWPVLLEYAANRLKLSIDGRRRAIIFKLAEPVVQKSRNGTNLVLRLLLTDLSAPKVLEIEYRLFFELMPLHRGLLELDCHGVKQTAIFSPDRATQRFELATGSRVKELLSFGWEGIWHIWIGFDHILFLLALLLPSVLERGGAEWRAITGLRPISLNVVKIVTAFTLAHSLTLSLATLQFIQLPSRWVESAIAASVLLAAINNLLPLFYGKVWLVAFGFGLIHGVGFASVLAGLNLRSHLLALALLGFNLGVELGQLAIVAVFMPTIYHLRSSRFYRRYVVQLGSVLIAVLASIWLAERLLAP